MENNQSTIKENIKQIKDLIGNNDELVIKKLLIGKKGCLEAVALYVNGLASKDIIDKDILTPLMLHVEEDLTEVTSIEEYICKRYITMSDTSIETDINKTVEGLKRGKTIVIIESSYSFIIVDTVDGVYRSISDPQNETSIRGARDSFVENLEINVSALRRRIKDKNLVTEKFVLGSRSQTDLVMMYIGDIADPKLVEEIRKRISSIDLDSAVAGGTIEQCIEDYPYSIFPQSIATERPDRVQEKLMEGRIAILLDGTPFVATVPAIFIEFFQTVEDYYNRTLVASFTRIIRYIASIIVITLPGVYITLIKFNSELIPLNFIQSIIQSRQGIALTPFMSLLSMNLVVEFLREGGLRLPGKIGQTLSVVGGIIIGDAAIRSKIISPTTLLVVGIVTVATFLIPNYEMSLSIRIIGYPMIVLANWLGMLGVAIGWFFILSYLCSLDSFGVPYFSFHKSDFKDVFIRMPIWKMNKRPVSIPHQDDIRQSDFRKKFRRGKIE